MYTDLTELGNLIDHTSEFLITDEKWTVLYRNHALDFTEEQWARWSMLYREETVEETGLSWEVADKAAGKYYNVRSFPDRHHICCCSGKAAGAVDYAMFCHVPDEKEQRLHAMLYNEFKLYIENALLQKQIVYENEHDHMTGIYNKEVMERADALMYEDKRRIKIARGDNPDQR